MDVSSAKLLKALGEENAPRQKVLDYSRIDNCSLEDRLGTNGNVHCRAIRRRPHPDSIAMSKRRACPATRMTMRYRRFAATMSGGVSAETSVDPSPAAAHVAFTR